MRIHAPRILRVQPQPPNALRKAAIARGSLGARDVSGRRRATRVKGKRPRVLQVNARIIRVLQKTLSRPRKRPAQYRLMNQADPEYRRMLPRRMAQVVAELIFLLIAQHRKRRNRRLELIVA